MLLANFGKISVQRLMVIMPLKLEVAVTNRFMFLDCNSAARVSLSHGRIFPGTDDQWAGCPHGTRIKNQH
jgi:hypothetical protein